MALIVAAAAAMVAPVAAEASLSFSASSTQVLEGDSFTLSASAPYEPGLLYVQIFEERRTWPVATCTIWNQEPCQGKTVYTSYSDDGNPPDKTFVAQLQNTNGQVVEEKTIDVAIERRPVDVTLSADGGVVAVAQGQPIPLTARTTYPTWNPYVVQIFNADAQDVGTDRPKATCQAPGPCSTTTYAAPGFHRYVAKVVSSGQALATSPEFEVRVVEPGAMIGPYAALAVITELNSKDFCGQLELAPQAGTHVVYESTITDQAIACRQAKLSGQLARFISTMGATGVGLLGIGLTMGPGPNALEPPTPPAPPLLPPAPYSPAAPPSGAISDSWSGEAVVDAILAQNPDLLSNEQTEERREKVEVIVDHCMWMSARAGGDPRDCRSIPLFVSGSDVADATDHDIEALGTVPAWAYLNYERGTDKPGTRWYATAPFAALYASSGCASRQTPEENCDEYPFFATLQGGPAAAPLPHIKPIPAGPNQLQGSLYNAFRATCNLSAEAHTGFLAVPIPPAFDIPTQKICNVPIP